jgi:membrane protease subunit (stomatin/prohibitin family)
MTDLTWGTMSPVDITDPELDQLLHVRANGMFGAHIESLDQGLAQIQVQKFIRKLVGTRAVYDRQDFINDMRREILGHVPELLANYMDQKQIGYLHIKNYMSDLSGLTKARLVGVFDEFGVTMDAFTFQDISVPESDLEAYRQRQVLKKEAEGNAIKMDIESAALARANERLGITELQKRQADILQTAAANEGQVGGFMGAGMGIGMGVGMGGVMGTGMRNVADSFFGDAAQSQMQGAAGAQGMAGGAPGGGAAGMAAGAASGAAARSDAGAAGEAFKICPQCNTRLEADAKFCMECGYKFQPAGQICPECGKTIPQNAKFCSYCGHKMIKACPTCGTAITPGAKFCPECGTAL